MDWLRLELEMPARPAKREMDRLHVVSLCEACHEALASATGWKVGATRRPCVKCGARTEFRAYLVTQVAR